MNELITKKVIGSFLNELADNKTLFCHFEHEVEKSRRHTLDTSHSFSMTQKYHGAQFSQAKVILKIPPAPSMAHREMPSNAQEKAGICLSEASCEKLLL